MTKKKFFASLGVMTALVGVSVFGAMMCMGNASADVVALKGEVEPASAAVSLASSDIPDWENGEPVNGMYWVPFDGDFCPICEKLIDRDAGETLYIEGNECAFMYTHFGARGLTLHTQMIRIHSGDLYVDDPTCSAPGRTYLKCDACGVESTLETIPVLPHSFNPGISLAADDEFCEDIKYTCTGCGAEYYGEDQIRTQRVRHEYELIDETPADCLNGGTRIKECKTCGHRVTEQIPKGEHSIPSDGIVTIEPTCTKTGLEEFYCTVCNKKVDERIVAALGHKWKTVPAVEATCTDDGMSEYTVCENCGEYFAGREPVVDEAEGHKWVTVEEDRDSCDVEGERKQVCEVCGEEEVETIPAGTHTWDEGTVTKAPTCLESGVRERTCVYCGAKDQETLSATGHISVNLAAVEATCTESGLTAGSKCSACGTILNAQQIVPAKGHTLKHVNAVEPSETAGGNIEYWHCANCGGYFTDKQGANQVSAEDVLLSPGEQTGMAWWQIALAVVAGVILIAGIGVVIDNFVINKDDNAFVKNKAKKEKK